MEGINNWIINEKNYTGLKSKGENFVGYLKKYFNIESNIIIFILEKIIVP